MKKVLYTALVGGLIFTSSCTKYIDGFDKSPNLPLQVNNGNLLTVSEVATQVNYSGNLARMTSCLVQQSSGIAFQYADYENYVIVENDMDNNWNSLYADAMINNETLINQAGDRNPYYRGMAKVMKALNATLATDLWGDVPYRDALRGLEGSTHFSPTYDAQQQIYADLQSLLNSAIADLSKPADANDLLPTAKEDIWYGGNVTNWIKAAWMLKARLAIHLSKRDQATAATDALRFIDSSGVMSSATDLLGKWGTNGNELNQWYSFGISRAGYIKMGSRLVNMMNTTNDPRLSFYASTDQSGGYSGTEPNSGTDTTSDVGAFFAGISSTSPMLTYVEMMFIKAEALFYKGDKAGAATAYNEAIKASVKMVTGSSNSAFEGAVANATAANITLDKIMSQKYVAMFTQVESFTDWRRTGIPDLQPNPGASKTAIPRRLPTPLNERVNNTNVKVVTDITSKMWWDQ